MSGGRRSGGRKLPRKEERRGKAQWQRASEEERWSSLSPASEEENPFTFSGQKGSDLQAVASEEPL